MNATTKTEKPVRNGRDSGHSLRELVLRLGLDRRKRYFWYEGILCVNGKYTDTCSGCFEGGENMGMAHYYDYDTSARCYVGAGCDECGYTGKRVVHAPEPVRIGGKLITQNVEAQGMAHKTANTTKEKDYE